MAEESEEEVYEEREEVDEKDEDSDENSEDFLSGGLGFPFDLVLGNEETLEAFRNAGISEFPVNGEDGVRGEERGVPAVGVLD